MIKEDISYNSHKDCDMIIMQFRPNNYIGGFSGQYRCYCTNHKKWLHTLKESEVKILRKISPEIFQ